MNQRLLAPILAAILVLMATTSVWARPDGSPATTLGIGDANTATASGAAAVFDNPAGMGIFRQYEMGASYGYTHDLESHALTASAVDSATNEYLGMGTAYTFVIGSGDDDREGHIIRAAVSTGYRSEDFAIMIGLGTNYTTLTGTGTNAMDFFTMDAGLILEIGGLFKVGVAAHNLIDTTQGRTGDIPAPREISIGAGLNIDTFQLSFDVDLDIQNADLPKAFRVGMQYLFGGLVVARVGFVVDQGIEPRITAAGDNYLITGGVGYISREFGIDAGFQKSVVDDDGTVFQIGFRYFMP